MREEGDRTVDVFTLDVSVLGPEWKIVDLGPLQRLEGGPDPSREGRGRSSLRLHPFNDL